MSQTSGGRLTAMNPMGYPPKISQLQMAQRFERLEGKTVYLVDCQFDDSDRLLKQIQYWFEAHMPSVNPVFVRKAGVYTEDDPALFEEIRDRGGAAIVGVGH